jgi:hypothetical protein
MTILRAQCTFQVDSANPTDGLTITPHFKVVNLPGLSNNIQGLADDLATALMTWQTINTQLTVKMYDAQHAKPNYPLATTVKAGSGINPASNNRDVALCLSYYATTNRPRRRGRIYTPCCVCGITPSSANATSTHMNKAAALVPIFTGLGGLDVDWVLFSRADNASYPVTNWYVDNAWDTQRSRGGKGTARVTGTTTEGNAPNLVALQPTWTPDDQEPALTVAG